MKTFSCLYLVAAVAILSFHSTFAAPETSSSAVSLGGSLTDDQIREIARRKSEEFATTGDFVQATSVLENAEKFIQMRSGQMNHPSKQQMGEASPPVNRAEPEGMTCRAGDVLPVVVEGVSFNLRWCPPGRFVMGSPISENGRHDDEAQHNVTLTKGFWMGETEVTRELWMAVMGNLPPENENGELNPVGNVSWNDCRLFVDSLNAHPDVRLSGLRFAMPTEAQWEYACRAGSTGPFAGLGLVDDMGWNGFNADYISHPVAQKAANAWGFYDMHGNLWEWCTDWYGFYQGGITDPTGPTSGDKRVMRGGNYCTSRELCRSACRDKFEPDYQHVLFGFRLCAYGGAD